MPPTLPKLTSRRALSPTNRTSRGQAVPAGILRIALTEAAVFEDGLVFRSPRPTADDVDAENSSGGPRTPNAGTAAAGDAVRDNSNNDWLAVETFGAEGEESATRTHTTDARAGSLTVVDLALDTTASIIVRFEGAATAAPGQKVSRRRR